MLLLTMTLTGAEGGAGITKISPVIYENAYMKSFLADYLKLTDAQMVQSDLAFAEARAKMFPLGEKLKQTQVALDTALSNGTPAAQWKLLVNSLSNTQAQLMVIECAALEKFRNLLDGEQRFKLGKLTQLSMATNEQGQPVVAYAVEQ